MKPLITNNLNFFGVLGLIVLFSIPVVGEIALIICLLFVKNSAVKKCAIIYFWVTFVLGFVFSILIEFNIIPPIFDYDIPFLNSEEIEVFTNSLPLI